MVYDMVMRGIVECLELVMLMGYGENVVKIIGVLFNDVGEVVINFWYSELCNYSYLYLWVIL